MAIEGRNKTMAIRPNWKKIKEMLPQAGQSNRVLSYPFHPMGLV